MKILSFSAEKLHGYLSFALRFNSELTFLTGINGSGKTSAVRAITALLKPSLLSLAELNYERISVSVEHEAKEFTISSIRNNEELSLVYTESEKDSIQFFVPLIRQPPYETALRFRERREGFYAEQESLYVQHPVFEHIRELPTPMFLDLERRHQDSTRIRRTVQRGVSRVAGSANPLGGTLAESLTSAQELAEDEYGGFLAKKTEATDRLKQDLILFAFQDIQISTNLDLWNRRPEFVEDLKKTERVVIQSLTDIGIPETQIGETVRPFFDRVRVTIEKIPTDFDLNGQAFSTEQILSLQEWAALQPRIEQINSMAERISKYNRLLGASFSRIDRYLALVNRFLSDSSKSLTFDARGNLHVAVKGESKERDIDALSSGERQIVVILTHLAFNRQAKRANILIIDEPELSLHLRWQELFVDAVRSASPGLQLILATHSPSVIKGRTEDCIDVREAWQDAGLFS